MTAATAIFMMAAGLAFPGAAAAQQPNAMLGSRPAVGLAGKLAGTWELSVDNGAEVCRLQLRAEKSDKGDFFLGLPAACRHAMPWLAKVGRWGLPDATHLTFDDPSATPVVTLAAAGDGFAATGSRVFKLVRVGGTDAGALDGPAGAVIPVARRKAEAEAEPAAPAGHVTAAEVAGRYAVMREKRDTGCMLTLDDQTRGKAGGDRAALAPGCRDQGIVIFDPVGWRLVRGELVLTARAGHTTKLDRTGDAAWTKDLKDGGKPLGLKRL